MKMARPEELRVGQLVRFEDPEFEYCGFTVIKQIKPNTAMDFEVYGCWHDTKEEALTRTDKYGLNYTCDNKITILGDTKKINNWKQEMEG